MPPSPDIKDVLENKVIWLNWLEMSWITSHGGEALDDILIAPKGSQSIQFLLPSVIGSLSVCLTSCFSGLTT